MAAVSSTSITLHSMVSHFSLRAASRRLAAGDQHDGARVGCGDGRDVPAMLVSAERGAQDGEVARLAPLLAGAAFQPLRAGFFDRAVELSGAQGR